LRPRAVSSATGGEALPELGFLRARLKGLRRVVVAFSGGADSALLAWVANDELGPEAALAVTAVSASLAGSELQDCRQLAAEWRLNYREVETQEVRRPGYVANGADRCWYCKDELMQSLVPLAGRASATIVLGVNVDDLSDHRPGQDAARKAGALFPLVEAGFTKSAVRRTSLALGLRTWDKPAAACLASRVPYGTPVNLSTLEMVARAEASLRGLGFRSGLRVRHYGDLARVELPLEDLARALGLREEVVRAVRSAGYRYVTLDLEGLRSGNLNAALASASTLAAPGKEVPA